MEYNENVEVYIMQRFGELKFSYREKIVCIKELLPWYFLNKGWKNKKSYLSVERSSLLKQKHYQSTATDELTPAVKRPSTQELLWCKFICCSPTASSWRSFSWYKLNDYYLRR